MDRRSFLRAAVVAGLAGCTPTGSEPVAAPTTAAPSSPGPVPSPTAAATPTPPAAPPSPEPTPRVRRAISRDLLGLPAPAPGGQPHTITGLMLHHTAAPVVPAAQAPERFRGHARGHRDAGFVDIAYHWGIDTAGTIYELRDEAIAGETFTEYDPAGWFLVVCEGNFEEARPTEAMLTAVADVLAAGAARHDVAPATLVGHRDRAATACPGQHLQDRIPDLAARVEALLAAGGVMIERTDDPAALPA